MGIQFDEIIDRSHTNCIKYDFREEMGLPAGVLPMWVADMDFRVADGITQQIEKVVRHGIYGYTDAKDDYYTAVTGWYEKHFGWKASREWIIKTPGIVFAIAAAIRAFTAPGESVLIQQPVYHPFRNMIVRNGRKMVNSPLILQNGHYEIDFADFEKKIEKEDVKLFILCSPHNPAGRVWTQEELRRMADICVDHRVIIVSDEIHSDFVWEGHTHHVLLSLDEKYAGNSIVCTAPSKSFNIAGLQCSNIFVPDEGLRSKFEAAVSATGLEEINTVGLAACQAAYESGEEWMREAKAYIYGNICFAEDYIRREIPQIGMIHPEGTYLLWLDFRSLGLAEEELKRLVQEKAGLWLNAGSMFGEEGKGFERMNVACPRQIVEQAMKQLKEAVCGM